MEDLGYFIGAILIVMVIMFFGISCVYSVFESYAWSNNVETYWKLADQSSILADKLDYLYKYKSELKELGLTEGNYAYIFKTPYTDLSNQMKVLDSLITRLEQAVPLSVDSLEYQQAIKQLTGDEFKGFDTCVFLDAYKHQSILRYIFFMGGDCQEGTLSSSDSM